MIFVNRTQRKALEVMEVLEKKYNDYRIFNVYDSKRAKSEVNYLIHLELEKNGLKPVVYMNTKTGKVLSERSIEDQQTKDNAFVYYTLKAKKVADNSIREVKDNITHITFKNEYKVMLEYSYMSLS